MSQLEKLENELENFERVNYRMTEEGMHYCFKHYSNWKEIEDKTFHTLRQEFLSSMLKLEEYVDIKIKILKNDIENYSEAI